jgi:uncharacterized protein (DUF2147 family)
MRKFMIACVIAAAPEVAFAGGVDGVWETENGKDGGYIEVTIAPCASDASLTCGTISRAFNTKGEDPGYPDLGRSIVEGMKHDGNGSYSGGTVWDPEDGKTYSSKMTLKGDVLDVEGCISIFCQGQDWKRVEP